MKVKLNGNDFLDTNTFMIKTNSHQTDEMGYFEHLKVNEGQSIPQDDYVSVSSNTEPRINSDDAILSSFFERGKVEPTESGDGFIGNVQENWGKVEDSWEFVKEWKREGFFEAMYDKSFFEVMKDFFTQLFHDISVFLLSNSDLFFLMPAILIMFATFIVGTNKYTKYTLPLWFAYFVTSILNKLVA